MTPWAEDPVIQDKRLCLGTLLKTIFQQLAENQNHCPGISYAYKVADSSFVLEAVNDLAETLLSPLILFHDSPLLIRRCPLSGPFPISFHATGL